MVTPFGKFLKQLVIEKDTSFISMAGLMDYSKAYLSLICSGQRQIPDDMIEKLKKLYKLTDQQVYEAQIAKLKTEGSFNVSMGKNKEKEAFTSAAYTIMETFPKLNEKQAQEVIDLFATFNKKKWPWQK